jgi:hypothetical protein
VEDLEPIPELIIIVSSHGTLVELDPRATNHCVSNVEKDTGYRTVETLERREDTVLRCYVYVEASRHHCCAV